MRKETVKRILLIAAVMVALLLGLKLFNDMAQKDLSDYDGGRGEIVDRIENM